MYLIIGDIHGCVKSLERLLDTALNKYNITHLFILGDFIDRGKCVKETLNALANLQKLVKTTLFLGNHEDLFLDFLEDTNRYEPNLWLYNGGYKTLESFFSGLHDKDLNYIKSFCKEHILDNYLNIFNSLKIYEELILADKKFILSHAGGLQGSQTPMEIYNNLIKKERNIFEPFIWQRDTDFKSDRYLDYTIVHGHTPTKNIVHHKDPNAPYINKDVRINIDTGCVYGYSLSSVILDQGGNYEFLSVKCLD